METLALPKGSFINGCSMGTHGMGLQVNPCAHYGFAMSTNHSFVSHPNPCVFIQLAYCCSLQVRGLVSDLNPGDCLLVPAFWWVHSELLQPNSCCLTLKLQPGPERCYSKGALLLQLNRMIEVQTAAGVGQANVRKLLLVSLQKGCGDTGLS